MEGLAEEQDQRSGGPEGAGTEAAIQGKRATYTQRGRAEPVLGGHSV